MAGMGTLNPVRAKSYLGKPDLSGIGQLLALQNKSIKGATDAFGNYGKISRGQDLDEQIQGMDLSTATPAQIAKLQGAGSLTPQALERLKGLEKGAESIQDQGFKTDAATTLFGRQKEMQGMRDASAMSRLNKNIASKSEQSKAEAKAGTDLLTSLSDTTQELDMAKNILGSKDSPPEAKQEAQAFISATEAKLAQDIGGIKAPTDIKKQLFEKATSGGITELGSTKTDLTDRFTKTQLASADSFTRQAIEKGADLTHTKGVWYLPNGQPANRASITNYYKRK